MTIQPSLTAGTNERKRLQKRWIVLLVISVILHFIAFDWAVDNITVPAPDAEPTVINVHVEIAPAPAAPPALPVKPVQTKTAITISHPIAHPASVPAPAEEAPTTAIDALSPEPSSTAGMETPGTSTETVTELPTSPAETVNHTAPPAPAIDTPEVQQPLTGLHYTVNPPSSAVLKYDATRVLRDGEITHGNAMIDWQSDGKTYRIRGEIGILFFTLLTFKSEGMTDDWGISPVIYTEKRFHKSETNTHFHRERNTISFSASTTTYPRTGGEQDRSSIVWQLAGIGRGDSAKFFPGTEIDLFVAGVRDGEIWRIQVIGQEEVEVGTGKVMAWHLARKPHPGSYEQKLDIWLAPQQQWYPVKLRYTETNSDYVELSLSNIQSATAK
jgi:Protein of unknown function (DUF3108)